MRKLAAATIVICTGLWAAAAFADPTQTYHRTVDFKITEPCGSVVVDTLDANSTIRPVTLDWDPFGGDYAYLTVPYPECGPDLEILIYVGYPDKSTMNCDELRMYKDYDCLRTPPDNFCSTVNCWFWSCDKSRFEYLDDKFKGHALMPCGLKFEITGVE